jgi:hypothetical protein
MAPDQLIAMWSDEPLRLAITLILAAFLVVFHFLMEPWRWIFFYLRNDSAINPRRVYASLFCTALTSYIVPLKLGVPIRFVILHKATGMKAGFAAIMLALDGALSLVVWGCFAGVSAVAISLAWRPSMSAFVAVAIVSAILIFLLIRTEKFKGLRAKLEEAVAQIDLRFPRLFALIITIAMDVFSYGVRHACLAALFITRTSDLFAAANVGIVATFIGIISGLPLGLIGYDATLISLMTMINGLTVADATLIALLNRAFNIGVALVLGIPAGMRLGLGEGPISIIRRLWKLANGTA